MKITLPKLPYNYDALEPYIDAQTMTIHHDKHHQAYVDKLQVALEGTEWVSKPLEEIVKNWNLLPKDKQMAVRNNSGGVWNHNLYWQIMAPKPKPVAGKIKQAIELTWGSLEKFKEIFTTLGLNRFGSGWVWLVLTNDKKLVIDSSANQDNPLMTGVGGIQGKPILTLDVWEHAYYLKYQNRRADYIAAWWNVVNWEKVDQLYMVK